MSFTWLYDQPNNLWHIFSGSNGSAPVNGDAAYCGHVKTSNDVLSGDTSLWPRKCSPCYASGSAAGLPIT